MAKNVKAKYVQQVQLKTRTNVHAYLQLH